MPYRPNVWILALTQAFAFCGPPLVVLVGGLIGAELAPSPGLATLPVALMVVGTAASTVPMPLLMRRLGRKPVFVTMALVAAGVALLAAGLLARASFWGFCFCVVLLGVANGAVQQYRFAAMESVSSGELGQAAARVLLGGLVAAVLGPQLAVWGEGISEAHFAGAFVLLAGLYLLAAVNLALWFREPPRAGVGYRVGGRPWREILGQQVLWAAILSAAVGYAVMSFIMTATPLSMHVLMHHSLVDTKRVIQSHILAMYVPSLFSGWLAARIGLRRLIYLGLGAFAGCVVVGESGQGLLNYWFALVLLGVGWNFLFVGGTALLPRSYRAEERFRVQSLNESLVFGSQALAALSSGWAIEQLGWYRFLLIAVPLMLLLAIVVRAWRRQEMHAAPALER